MFKSYLSIIARYELKILLRDKVFILFACLSIGGIPLLQYFFQEQASLYHFKALACSFPFINAFLFNILQSLAVIFVAGDFVRRERHCDSLEAIRSRSYTNFEYITGKYIAVVSIFLVLNICTAFPVLILHWWGSDSLFDFWLYPFYLFTLTLPALLFIAGLTILIQVLVRIPYLALVILLGFLVLEYLYLTEYKYGSMDFLATSLPNIFSEVTGHVGLGGYLWQRLTIILMGLAMLLFVVSVIKRRDGRHRASLFLYTMTGILFIGGIMSGGHYCNIFEVSKQEREKYRGVYRVYQRKERVSILSQQIIYRQTGDQLAVVDTLVFKNAGKYFLKEVVLYLNPGLQVTRIESDKKIIPFYQDEQALVMQYGLKADSISQIVICYEGNINENICYLDIRDKRYEQTVWSNNLLCYGKHNAMVSDRYTFLTPECLWYPVATPPVNLVNPWLSDTDFIDFKLSVFHKPNYTAISQGQVRTEENSTCFINSHPLSGITLCIGPYRKTVYEIDSIDFEIYALKPGIRFGDLFDGRSEDIRQGLKVRFDEMKFEFGGYYPYRKLALVEVPVALSTYLRDWKTGSEFVQPELLFQSESWCKNTYYQPISKYVGEIKKFGIQDSVSSLVTDYISIFFHNQFGEKRDEFSPMSLADYLRGHRIVLSSVRNQVPLTPLFTDFIRKIHSVKFPGIDRLISPLYLNRQSRLRLVQEKVGISTDYKAIRYLRNASLKRAFGEPQAWPDMQSILRLKSSFLEKYLSALVGVKELQNFLQDRASHYIFQHVPIEEFCVEFNHKFGLDLTEILIQLYEQQGLPVLRIQHIEQKLVKRKDNEAAFVIFEVYNPTEYDGVVTCYAESADHVSDFQEVKNVIIRGGDCCRVVISLEGRKRKIVLHTNLSENIPMEYEVGFGDELPEITELQEGVFPLERNCFRMPSNEIIVDNEEKGFQIKEPPKGKKLLCRREKTESEYGNGVDFLTQNFSGWLKSVYPGAYGGTIRSFYGKVAENGKSEAIWKVNIPEGGIYELYVYQLGLQNRFQTYDLANYYYTLEQLNYRADITVGISKTNKKTIQIEDNLGYTNELEFHMDPIRKDNWVPLGIYDLRQGEVKLVLHDRGAFPGQLIFADAIKWVKREK